VGSAGRQSVLYGLQVGPDHVDVLLDLILRSWQSRIGWRVPAVPRFREVSGDC
jgi:hypothetical protein